MSGFQVGPACYGTQVEAVSAIVSAQVGTVRDNGSAGLVVVDASAFDASSISYTFTPIAGGTPTTATVGVSVQPCALLTWEDGMTVGWLVGSVWLITAALLHIRRGLVEPDKGVEGYGNA